MDAFELKAKAGALLAKIHVITGWNFPEEIEYQKILKDQFIKKLIESYPTVNCDEIEYAFRNHPVKEWGKKLSINLVGEVMAFYLEHRKKVSDMEEHLDKPQLPAPVEDPMSNEEFIELNKNIYLKTKNFALVSERCYTILINEDKMKRPTGEDRLRILKTARAWFFKENDQVGMSHEEQERKINIFSKKICVCEYFNSL